MFQNQLSHILDLELWRLVIAGNSIGDYVWALFLFISLYFLFSVLYRLLIGKFSALADKTKTELDNALIKIIENLRPSFYVFLAFYLAVTSLTISQPVMSVLVAVMLVLVVYQAISALQVFIDILIRRSFKSKDERESRTAIDLMGKISKGVLWSLGALLILSNLGLNITSLIAGLGIGGIAVALALQNVLEDLFSSFAIYFDKPFVIGDFIIIGEKMGIVESIGIKSTRLRALQGEEIVISNRQLTTSEIQNFKKMTRRRIVFSFGVTYETELQKLQEIPSIIKNIIDSNDHAEYDRAHFQSFGDSSLRFEVVYFIKSGNYHEYMDTNQYIHFKIKEEFESQRINMAYPTQTLYVLNKTER
jgi:small-conductance mechanosensitive channel